MKITKNTVVSLRYKLMDAKGKLIEEGRQPMVYLHGGYDNTFPKIEAALDERLPGYQTTLELQPQDAFGERDEKLVTTVARNQLPSPLKVGKQLQGRDGEGGEPRIFTVIALKGDNAVLDGNHPLAGKELRFQATVLTVRAATEEEIAHRHVHGPDGHHHH
jgi:FKBP-type peptidyl-prolyl cis-trans isomerase SlyD